MLKWNENKGEDFTPKHKGLVPCEPGVTGTEFRSHCELWVKKAEQEAFLIKQVKTSGGLVHSGRREATEGGQGCILQVRSTSLISETGC